MDENDEAMCWQLKALITSPNMEHSIHTEDKDVIGGIDWRKTNFFKINTDIPYHNAGGVRNNALDAWNPDEPAKISQHNDRVEVVVFDSVKDMNDVLAQSPWSFKDDTILLGAVRPNTVLSQEYTFSHLDIWL